VVDAASVPSWTPLIRAVVGRRVRRADVDDVVQDALLELLGLIGKGVPLHRGYVIGVARNISLVHLRSNPGFDGLQAETVAEEMRASIGSALRERLEQIVHGLSGRLSLRDRQVVQGVTECATLSEVARRVGLDRQQVRRSIERFVGLARGFLF